MRLIVDENLPFTQDFFGDTAELVHLPGAAFTPEAVREADGLLVRSVTQVNQQLLQNSRVRFVGTATIGVDHVDQHGLQQAGIHFVNAPGCNADSVVDYVIASLLWLAAEQDFVLRDQCIGIVGVGQVGGRLAKRLQAYGCRVVLNDPPRAAQGEVGFIDLHSLLGSADIVCLHTPLHREGDYPSWHLISEPELALLQGKVLLNAGRGAVVDQQALKQALAKGKAPLLLLDVFEGEPSLDAELINQCLLATPHIAGYSLEGKSRGSEMIYQAWCDFIGQPASIRLVDLLPTSPMALLQLDASCAAEEACRRAAHLCYSPLHDSWRLLQALKTGKPSEQVYQMLRKHYPVRREFSSLRVKAATAEQASALSALGFTVTS